MKDAQNMKTIFDDIRELQRNEGFQSWTQRGRKLREVNLVLEIPFPSKQMATAKAKVERL